MLATPSKTAAIVRDFCDFYLDSLSFMTGRVRSALVAELVLGVVTAQDSSISINSDDVFALLRSVQLALTQRFGDNFFR